MGIFRVIIKKLFLENVDIIFMKNMKNHQKNNCFVIFS